MSYSGATSEFLTGFWKTCNETEEGAVYVSPGIFCYTKEGSECMVVGPCKPCNENADGAIDFSLSNRRLDPYVLNK
jgi:hypothetical protein